MVIDVRADDGTGRAAAEAAAVNHPCVHVGGWPGQLPAWAHRRNDRQPGPPHPSRSAHCPPGPRRGHRSELLTPRSPRCTIRPTHRRLSLNDHLSGPIMRPLRRPVTPAGGNAQAYLAAWCGPTDWTPMAHPSVTGTKAKCAAVEVNAACTLAGGPQDQISTRKHPRRPSAKGIGAGSAEVAVGPRKNASSGDARADHAIETRWPTSRLDPHDLPVVRIWVHARE